MENAVSMSCVDMGWKTNAAHEVQTVDLLCLSMLIHRQGDLLIILRYIVEFYRLIEYIFVLLLASTLIIMRISFIATGRTKVKLQVHHPE